MALAAATHWEVRGGTGADTNGGGFAGDGSLAAPSAPSLATTTGGSLTVATWYIVISYCFYNGTTSYSGPKSAETSIVIPNTTNDAIVVTSPAASTGATHYRVWGVATTSGGPYWPLGSTTGTAIGTNVTITTVVTSGTQCPGVDYSQQAAAQVDIDNATITTSSATGSTTLTFTAGYTPTAADVGNQVRINGGTYTVGYRQIVGWTATTWIADAAWQSSGGTVTDLTAKMGGALATIGSQTTTTMPASVVAGNYIWIKAATYAETWTISVSGGGRTTITWSGYNAVRGDNPTGTNRPLVDGGSARANCLTAGSALGNFVRYFRFANATSHGVTASGNGNTFLSCKSSNNGSGGFINCFTAVDCQASSNTGTGMSPAAGGMCVNVYCSDNSVGFSCASNVIGFFVNCIADSNSTIGFEYNNRSPALVNCTSYNAGTDGIKFTSGAGQSVGFIINSIISNSGGFGINVSGATSLFVSNCDAYSNSSGTGSGVPEYVAFVTSDPQFVDAAGGNFNVGANMKGIGSAPGVNVGLAANSSLDLGAMQRQELDSAIISLSTLLSGSREESFIVGDTVTIGGSGIIASATITNVTLLVEVRNQATDSVVATLMSGTVTLTSSYQSWATLATAVDGVSTWTSTIGSNYIRVTVTSSLLSINPVITETQFVVANPIYAATIDLQTNLSATREESFSLGDTIVVSGLGIKANTDISSATLLVQIKEQVTDSVIATLVNGTIALTTSYKTFSTLAAEAGGTATWASNSIGSYYISVSVTNSNLLLSPTIATTQFIVISEEYPTIPIVSFSTSGLVVTATLLSLPSLGTIKLQYKGFNLLEEWTTAGELLTYDINDTLTATLTYDTTYLIRVIVENGLYITDAAYYSFYKSSPISTPATPPTTPTGDIKIYRITNITRVNQTLILDGTRTTLKPNKHVDVTIDIYRTNANSSVFRTIEIADAGT